MPRYGLQHILIERSNWHQRLRRALVKASIYHNHEIEFLYDKHALPPEADRGRPLNLASVNKRAAEPEEVAIEIRTQAVNLRHRRGDDPLGRDDLRTFPVTTLQDELADLSEISRAQAQGARGDDIAVRISGPFHVRDADG